MKTVDLISLNYIVVLDVSVQYPENSICQSQDFSCH